MIYRAKCLDCKHEWTSREGYGTPNYCPKCRKTRITVNPIGGQFFINVEKENTIWNIKDSTKLFTLFSIILYFNFLLNLANF